MFVDCVKKKKEIKNNIYISLKIIHFCQIAVSKCIMGKMNTVLNFLTTVLKPDVTDMENLKLESRI